VTKCITKIAEDLNLVEVKHNGETLKFLNGTVQMDTKNRFIPARSPIDGGYMLIIEDYAWWHVNHYDVTDWMLEHLPRGVDHQAGMIITFDTEEQRTWFMLKWQ
jgi:hypothetical protein